MALALVAMSCALHSNATAVRSDHSDTRNALFPSDHYTVPDADQLTGLRVALPKPDCSVYVSDCEDIDVINQLDGFNVRPRIAIPFTDAIGCRLSQVEACSSSTPNHREPVRHAALR
jgi:hypothetical protein